VSESIQVTAQNTLLQTETSSTGTVSLGDTLYKMPLFQRLHHELDGPGAGTDCAKPPVALPA